MIPQGVQRGQEILDLVRSQWSRLARRSAPFHDRPLAARRDAHRSTHLRLRPRPPPRSPFVLISLPGCVAVFISRWACSGYAAQASPLPRTRRSLVEGASMASEYKLLGTSLKTWALAGVGLLLFPFVFWAIISVEPFSSWFTEGWPPLEAFLEEAWDSLLAEPVTTVLDSAFPTRLRSGSACHSLCLERRSRSHVQCVLGRAGRGATPNGPPAPLEPWPHMALLGCLRSHDLVAESVLHREMEPLSFLRLRDAAMGVAALGEAR